MRVLWLAREIPQSLNSGDKVYSFWLANSLQNAGAEVHFVGMAGGPDGKVGAIDRPTDVNWKTVSGSPRGPLSALMSGLPLVGARTNTRQFRSTICDLLRENSYDIVIVDQYGLSWAIPFCLSVSAHNRVFFAHISHDFETEVTRDIAENFQGSAFRKIALDVNAKRTAKAELDIAKRCDLIVTNTQRDAEKFAQIGATGRFVVIPPGYSGVRRSTRMIDANTPRRVVIVGSYRWIAKQINLSQFLEAADEKFFQAGIELVVVGDVPDDFRIAWAARLRACRFVGFVDDLDTVLDGCRVGVVAEAVGGGFKHKVLNYVFTRTPVAALNAAVLGQDDSLVANFVVRESPALLVESIINVIDELGALNRMQNGAFAVGGSRYDWFTNGRRLYEAIDDTLRCKR